jgi:hypothetical protein
MVFRVGRKQRRRRAPGATTFAASFSPDGAIIVLPPPSSSEGAVDLCTTAAQKVVHPPCKSARVDFFTSGGREPLSSLNGSERRDV